MSAPLCDGNAPTSAGIPSADPATPGTPAPGDPVKALLHRHRELCVRAVDPLEIAAVLEARGIAEHVAADCRHRDVFSLAEELYARVRRDPAPTAWVPGRHVAPREAPMAHPAGADGWWTAGRFAALWLIAYGLLGDALLSALLDGRRAGRPDLVRALSAAAPTALALACAVALAAWCARWYALRVGHALAVSRTLGAFRTRAWPALVTATGLFLGAFLALLWALHAALDRHPLPYPAAPLAATTALGGLLFLARLTAVRGCARAGALAVLAACAAEAVPLLGAWLPGGGPLGALASAAAAHGPAAIPLVACAVPALALLGHALTALSRASAHRRGAPATAPDGLTDPADPGTPPMPQAPGTPARPPHPEPHTPSEEQGR
ncbi:hypothetical protein [Streptomyces blastmyceticus]|uniref:Integral membrane protein n=1 Tax=Streptomyces blastmyceticus TaxID=68180 RepID=A0ABP3HRH7_9ACTN